MYNQYVIKLHLIRRGRFYEYQDIELVEGDKRVWTYLKDADDLSLIRMQTTNYVEAKDKYYTILDQEMHEELQIKTYVVEINKEHIHRFMLDKYGVKTHE